MKVATTVDPPRDSLTIRLIGWPLLLLMVDGYVDQHVYDWLKLPKFNYTERMHGMHSDDKHTNPETM